MPTRSWIAVVASLFLLPLQGAPGTTTESCPTSVDAPCEGEGESISPLIGSFEAATCLEDSFTILVLGDSVASGTQGRPVGVPYSQLLEERLIAELDPGIVVVNAACGGTSTHDWASDEASCCPEDPTRFAIPNLLERRAQPHLPADVVILLVGGNDATGFGEPYPRPPAEYAEALTTVIDKLWEAGVRKIVKPGSPKLHPLEKLCRRAEKNARLALLRAVDHELCAADPRIDCGPELFYLLDASDYALCNPHPNAHGQQKMADALFDTLVRVYRELNPIAVEIDALPWRPNNRIRMHRSGEPLRRFLPVAILGSPERDIPDNIDLATLRFGVTGDEDSLVLRRRPGASQELIPACFWWDHGRDGVPDLVCRFDARQLGLEETGTQPLVLTGRTLDADYVRGEASVSVLPAGGRLWFEGLAHAFERVQEAQAHEGTGARPSSWSRRADSNR